MSSRPARIYHRRTYKLCCPRSPCMGGERTHLLLNADHSFFSLTLALHVWVVEHRASLASVRRLVQDATWLPHKYIYHRPQVLIISTVINKTKFIFSVMTAERARVRWGQASCIIKLSSDVLCTYHWVFIQFSSSSGDFFSP